MNNIRTEIQLFIIIFFMGISLTGLSFLMDNRSQAQSLPPLSESVRKVDQSSPAELDVAVDAAVNEAHNMAADNIDVELVDASTSVTFTVAFTYFLPFISKFPTPTPPPLLLVYSEDFNDEDAWPTGDSGVCKTEIDNGQFRVYLDKTDRECLPAGPHDDDDDSAPTPFQTYGVFEVAGYHSEGSSDAGYGIFINGEGGDDYYLFRIWPNNGCSSGGDWDLLRNKDGHRITVRSGDCEPIINRGLGIASTNVLRISHETNRTLTVYINGKEVGTFTDSAQDHRTGIATGVYVRSANHDVLMKFDDFKAYSFQ